MSDALEYAKRAIKSEADHPGVNPQILLLARAVVRQDEELVALKEKYRWRKQSEEPAPEDVRVFIYDAYRGLFFIDSCLYKKTIDYIFWRPLDLPDEARD